MRVKMKLEQKIQKLGSKTVSKLDVAEVGLQVRQE